MTLQSKTNGVQSRRGRKKYHRECLPWTGVERELEVAEAERPWELDAEARDCDMEGTTGRMGRSLATLLEWDGWG